MRPWLTLLLSCLSLWVMACTKKPPASTAVPVLTPEAITVQSYFGFSTRTVVNFRLDGQPLAVAEAEISFMHESGRPAFDVVNAPLSNELVVIYAPDSGSESRVLLILKYRGREYSVPIQGVSLLPPACEFSKDSCVTNQFNPASEQCERLQLSNTSCESVDCANPGLCASGACVHHEIEHAAPGCSQVAPLKRVTPTWNYTPPPGNAPIGPLVLDEEGSSYFFELGQGEFVSLDGSGAVRWRKPLIGNLSTDENRIDLRTTGPHVFVLDRLTNHLWVFQRADGTLLWERTFERSIRMLPVGDELWTLVDVHNPLGAELDILEAATGTVRDVPVLPLNPDGGRFAYYDLVADDEASVYLIGTGDLVNPEVTAIAALDPVTRELRWTESIFMTWVGLSLPAARTGSLLLFQNGIAFNLKSRQFFANVQWQKDLATLNSRSFVLNDDGTGYRASSTRASCSTVTLSHVNVRTGSPDWECFLGSTMMSGGLLARTPSGSAVVMTLDVQKTNILMPRLRIIGASGVEQFDGLLSVGRIETSSPPLLSIRGQRLLIRQVQEHSTADLIVAYDITELLTR